MAAMKVEIYIIVSISASPVGRAVIMNVKTFKPDVIDFYWKTSWQGSSLLCYSTEAVGAVWGTGAKPPPPISDFEQFRVYLGPVLLQNSHKNMSQLYTIVHSWWSSNLYNLVFIYFFCIYFLPRQLPSVAST